MSFIITGMPRSGTMFIQKNMNKSNKFNVTHDNKDIIDLVHRFYLTKNKDLLKNINKKLSGNFLGNFWKMKSAKWTFEDFGYPVQGY